MTEADAVFRTADTVPSTCHATRYVRVLGARRFGRGARRFSRWPRAADKVAATRMLTGSLVWGFWWLASPTRQLLHSILISRGAETYKLQDLLALLLVA